MIPSSEASSYGGMMNWHKLITQRSRSASIKTARPLHIPAYT
ncbi:hypothetical protein C4K13_4011 [Pseudomonas chlororaphis subsp. aureofaciens]|nr:hypothetical protein C4K13_4011 [Pseudomonas chlororaphis subsp. aureofaciens]